MDIIREYHLRIVPPKPIYNDVTNFKNEFIEIFGKHKYSKAKPHITLALFKMDTQYEDLIVKSFQQLTIIKKFEIKLKGFNIFDTRTYVLFLDIQSVEPFHQIQASIEDIWSRNFKDIPSKLITTKHPHMTISTAVNKNTLIESFEIFKQYSYDKSFEVDHIVLTSRLLSHTWDWEHYIPLSN